MELKRGQLTQLAETAGVSVSFLCDIVNGHKRCPSALAVKLELISEGVLGVKVPSKDWILAGLGLKGESNVTTEATG